MTNKKNNRVLIDDKEHDEVTRTIVCFLFFMGTCICFIFGFVFYIILLNC